MHTHAAISPEEAADRLAIRELFDAYAHCADRRDAESQKWLCSRRRSRFAVYMSGEGSEPTYVLEGREALSPVLRRPEPVRRHDSLQRPEHHDPRRRHVRPASATPSLTTYTPPTASARS